jgi:transglutaminase-like putative cysteine protease
MIKTAFRKYAFLLERRAIYLTGFLLSLSLILVAVNSIPKRVTLDDTIFVTILVWTGVFLTKPIRKYLISLVMVIQSLWFFSVASILSPSLQLGFDKVFHNGTAFANFIYKNLYGDYYVDAISWIKNFLFKVSQADNPHYYWLFITMVAFAFVGVITYMLEEKINWKFLLAAGVYFVVAWFLYISRLELYFSIFFIGVTLYKQINAYEEVIEDAGSRGERTRYYNYNSSVMVGGIVMALVLVLAHISIKFIPMTELNLKLDETLPKLSNIRTEFVSRGRSNTFSFASTMYSPNGRALGGPILERDYSVVFRVEAEEGGLYLRGRTKNEYTGTRWNSDYNTYRNNVFVGDLYTALPKEHVSEITVFPEKIKTRTLFSPYLYYISNYDRRDVYGNMDDIVYVKEDLNTDYKPYNVFYVKDEFVHLYDELLSSERENYLKLPKDGLKKTEALTQTIVQGITDPLEKMNAIETYLRENYRYTLYTQEITEDVDFVENFLFEEEEGYCTYFASALAVMGRFADVPTRYVEGYLTSEFLDIDGLYEVTANRAHAWVEAYIEGEGWVTFEATPAYAPPEPSEEETALDDFALNSDVDLEDEDVEVDDSTDQPQTGDETPVEEEKFNISIELIVNILVYAVIIALFILIVYKKYKRVKHDVEVGNPTEKINYRIHYMMSMSRLINNEFNSAELPKDVLYRICEYYLEMKMPKEIALMIEKSLYSKQAFTQEDFEAFDIFFNDFELHFKNKVTRFSHFMHKYLLNTLYHRNYYD